MKIIRASNRNGFTIVELLIVIVVIAILAAITTVSFSGIQTRAENTKTISGVGEYAKALRLYQTANGVYPITAYPCLGPAASTCANVTDATPACNGAVNTTGNATFQAAILSVVAAMPTVSSQKMNCGGKLYSGAYYYSNASGKTANIIYLLRGDVGCETPGSAIFVYKYPVNGETTMCNVRLPNL